MTDPSIVDKLAQWANLAYLVALGLTLAMSVVAVLLSHRRASILEAELQKIRTEPPQRAAVGVAPPQTQPGSSDREAIDRRNRELALQLEIEKKLRLEAENRLNRQQLVPVVPAPALPVQTGPRRMSAGEEHELLLRLRRFEGTRVTLIELMDPEAGAFARQLAGVLTKANWNVATSRIGSLTPSQYGIICTHAASDDAASLLVETLRSFKLTVYERNGTGPFEILVGLKPV